MIVQRSVHQFDAVLDAGIIINVPPELRKCQGVTMSQYLNHDHERIELFFV
ncbi:hypothetical protein [Vibrio diabolicus]|uniref:hypothetical protein n=1 Tax=Vibrio diabolicus TaxID=50719 RepID=UPI00373E38E4